MNKVNILIIILICANSYLFGQNYLGDESFEYINESGVRGFKLKYWKTVGSTDVYSKDRNIKRYYDLIDFDNSKGRVLGLYLLSDEEELYTEAIQAELITPFVKDVKYKIRLKVQVDSGIVSKFVDSIGCIFRDSFIESADVGQIEYAHSSESVVLRPVQSENDSGSWHFLEAEYVAKGDEKVIQVGLVLPDFCDIKNKDEVFTSKWRLSSECRKYIRKNIAIKNPEMDMSKSYYHVNGFYMFIDGIYITEM